MQGFLSAFWRAAPLDAVGRKKRFGHGIRIAVLMGIGVGGNRELLANLSAVGAEALALSLSAAAGSIAVGAWMYKKLLERGIR